MLVFYRHDGTFLALSKEDDSEDANDKAKTAGDSRFITEISNGNSSWSYHERVLSTYDDGIVRAVVLPDYLSPPETLLEALVLHVKLGLSGALDPDPEYKLFTSFEFVGPMLMARFPDEFGDWIENKYRSDPREDFIHDVEVLRSQIPADISPENFEHADRWPKQVSDFFDHAFLWVDSEFSVSDFDEQSMLFKLAPGDWVELDDFYGGPEWEGPTEVFFSTVDEANEAEKVAHWIEGHHGGYLAAIALLVKPDLESKAEDADVFNRESEAKQSFREIAGMFSLEIDVLSFDEANLIDALVKASPQFHEFFVVFSKPESGVYPLLLQAAKDLNPGFAGQRGSILEWM